MEVGKQEISLVARDRREGHFVAGDVDPMNSAQEAELNESGKMHATLRGNRVPATHPWKAWQSNRYIQPALHQPPETLHLSISIFIPSL